MLQLEKLQNILHYDFIKRRARAKFKNVVNLIFNVVRVFLELYYMR